MVKNYEDFKAEVLKITTIDLSAYKERQMKRRLDSLIRKNKFKDYEEYVRELAKKTAIYEEFINYMTINVSEFFRNTSQWNVLEQNILPYLFEHFGKDITIWSAACSTGDEPYSLAMVLSKYLPLNKIKIIATDIDNTILGKAKSGRYTDKSIAGVPSELKNKYFSKDGDFYVISDDIKRCIDFRQHNLLKDKYPTNLDMIVCRNVLIYFTEEAKVEIYKKFNRSLKDKGILFVGSTEQIIHSQDYHFYSDFTFFYKKDGDV